jgi:hypothetical protein
MMRLYPSKAKAPFIFTIALLAHYAFGTDPLQMSEEDEMYVMTLKINRDKTLSIGRKCDGAV